MIDEAQAPQFVSRHFSTFAHTILGKAYGKHATFPEVFLQSLVNNVSKHPFCYIEPAAVDTDF